MGRMPELEGGYQPIIEGRMIRRKDLSNIDINGVRVSLSNSQQTIMNERKQQREEGVVRPPEYGVTSKADTERAA